MPPSWFLFAMIVVGGAMAVIANTLYPLAKAREGRERLASDARAILLPEVKRNSELVLSIEAILAANNIPLQKFDVTAWETISKGGLLLGLEPAEITKLLHVYSLAYQANDLSAQLLDSATGVRSALANASQTKQVFLGNLQRTLKELEAAFSDLEPEES